MKIRKSIVAGKFFPADKEALIKQIESVRIKELPGINLDLKNNKILGGIVPHAGYMFSAYQAVHFFEIIKQSKQKFDTIVIVNPNHTGLGHEISFDSNDSWETPLGQVSLDIEFGARLGIDISDIEQKHEHSGEVMVPFLQYFLDYEFKIAPITLSNQTYKNVKFLAERIFESSKILKREILIIASSDFSHFLSPERGREMDALVLENIITFDSPAIEKVVRKKNISVCGFGPIMTLIEYSNLISKKPKADILKIGHSGEIIPSNEVVDYISILFSDF
ncbi:MAG: AmmeMemoRadiSam system protein B [Bacteroidales bacterium]|jgi:AmmeMemoRadiSam system protein B|nr:AmmeMemoRadiSam system protein B [Bacteroidales bacterium]